MTGSVRRRRDRSQIIRVFSVVFAFVLLFLIRETTMINNLEMNIRYDANVHGIDDMNNMIEEAAFDDGEINNEEEEGTISSKKRNEISTDKSCCNLYL